MEEQSGKETKSPSQLIDERMEELGDWRGRMLGVVRTIRHFNIHVNIAVIWIGKNKCREVLKR